MRVLLVLTNTVDTVGATTTTRVRLIGTGAAQAVSIQGSFMFYANHELGNKVTKIAYEFVCGISGNKCSWRCYDCQPPSWLETLVSKLPNPKCMQWCSQAGYCGDTPDHKKYGTDCTGCINEGNM